MSMIAYARLEFKKAVSYYHPAHSPVLGTGFRQRYCPTCRLLSSLAQPEQLALACA